MSKNPGTRDFVVSPRGRKRRLPPVSIDTHYCQGSEFGLDLPSGSFGKKEGAS